ncbi:nitroreductase family deazaflavin-dependent oxidoreductase [Streptomyces sp. NBC_01537]|uniref:nitroreductase family deazaflavin-dependent oxidoreductase n=1 Tax=Streptomyces sp. NBC_01537 TaxID=2903896 RepID=UPI00386B26A7
MPLKGEYEPSKAQFVRDQVELYESSGGTQGTTLSVLVAREEDERLRDLPVVILTTLGAKSGKIRKTPVMRVEHDGSYAVVASMAGAPKHPIWYHNVVADPVRHDMLAREVTGDEKAVWWARAVEAFPDYAEYQKNTTREIPVLVLSRRPRNTDAAQPVQPADPRRLSVGPQLTTVKVSTSSPAWPTTTLAPGQYAPAPVRGGDRRRVPRRRVPPGKLTRHLGNGARASNARTTEARSASWFGTDHDHRPA